MGRRRYTAAGATGDHGFLIGLGDNDHPQYTLDPHGAAQHTDAIRERFLPALEGYISSGTGGPKGAGSAVNGGADLNEPFVYFSMKVPDDFVSFSSVRAVWLSPAVAGNMWWSITSTYAAPGEAYNIHSDSPADGSTATGGSNILNVQEPANPLTLADLAAGDYLGLLFSRRGANANDTLDDTVSFLGLLFTYTAEQ